MPRLGEREIFLAHVAKPVLGNHARVELRRDFPRRVGAAGIDDENFVHQRRDTLQAAGQVSLFVKGDEARGDFHRSIVSAAAMAASAVTPFMQAKSSGHSRRKQGLHGT